jgi:hypothetical protein
MDHREFTPLPGTRRPSRLAPPGHRGSRPGRASLAAVRARDRVLAQNVDARIPVQRRLEGWAANPQARQIPRPSQPARLPRSDTALWFIRLQAGRMNDHSSATAICQLCQAVGNERQAPRIKGHGIDPDRRNTMKTLTLALATVLGIAFVAPITAAQAETTKKVIIKRGGHDRGHHYGWRNHHGGNKVVIIKKRRHHEM